MLLDDDFNIAGRWEQKADGLVYNYDFWYQPRHNVMISSEFAAPKTYEPGFNLEDVTADKYGHRLHFWDWQQHELTQSIDLGPDGRTVPGAAAYQQNGDGPALTAHDVVVIVAGVNDVYQSRGANAVIRELEAMYDIARAAKIPLVAGTILPFNTATPDQNDRMQAVNATFFCLPALSRRR